MRFPYANSSISFNFNLYSIYLGLSACKPKQLDGHARRLVHMAIEALQLSLLTIEGRHSLDELH